MVVEAESSRIGELNLPPKLFEAMKAAPRITIGAPVAARAEFLARTYCGDATDAAGIPARLERLVGLRGRSQVDAWKLLAREGHYTELAEALMVSHYDPRYAKGRERFAPRELAAIHVNGLREADLDQLARQVDKVLR